MPLRHSLVHIVSKVEVGGDETALLPCAPQDTGKVSSASSVRLTLGLLLFFPALLLNSPNKLDVLTLFTPFLVRKFNFKIAKGKIIPY